MPSFLQSFKFISQNSLYILFISIFLYSNKKSFVGLTKNSMKNVSQTRKLAYIFFNNCQYKDLFVLNNGKLWLHVTSLFSLHNPSFKSIWYV